MSGGVQDRKRRGGFSDINVTPLVDVMLVLLVVFMVTAPMLTAGIDIQLPEVEAASTPVADSRLIVTITKDGRTILGKEDISGRVAAALQAHPKLQSEKILFIRADRDARYGEVARLVALARQLGIHGLNLLVEPGTMPPDTLPSALPNKDGSPSGEAAAPSRE
ncbi:MAG: biopolymer transporter ExbD [Polyangiaceae bacterium]|nr:biopolymer transporter ExbD [Polyangiaceae bacterium]